MPLEITVHRTTLFALLGVLAACGTEPADPPASESPEIAPSADRVYDLDNLPVEEAVLGYAPEVAPPIDRDHPARVVVELEVTEEVGRLGDGVEYLFWTFGGSVPGPMIRVREGDMVELHLMNHPDSRLPHNIDLHSVVGQGGGAEATFVAPGERKSFTFRALQPGVYIYHCATAPVGLHIANGMYGLIVVEPEEGYPPVDKEFYVVQSEFYTPGDFGEAGQQPFDLDRALREDPAYVVFNGAAGSLVGDNAMRAEVGDSVRIFFGNGGPNLVSSFHVIGEIFDTVRHEGGTVTNHNVQTTLVPAGGSTIVEFQTRVPATYVLVDHSIFRAFNKGALGMLVVDGDEDEQIFHADHRADVYTPSPGRRFRPEPTPEAPAGPDARTDAERLDAGQVLYQQNCASCHGERGDGIAGAFPPVAGSHLLADNAEMISSIRQGRRGDVGIMPGFPHLSSRQIADLVSYVQHTWGDADALLTADEVEAAQ